VSQWRRVGGKNSEKEQVVRMGGGMEGSDEEEGEAVAGEGESEGQEWAGGRGGSSAVKGTCEGRAGTGGDGVAPTHRVGGARTVSTEDTGMQEQRG